MLVPMIRTGAKLRVIIRQAGDAYNLAEDLQPLHEEG